MNVTPGRRCAAGSSTRGALGRWSSILDSSSPAAVPKNRRRWHRHKWPHIFPARFLHSCRKTWNQTGDCFFWIPVGLNRGASLASSPVADLPIFTPQMKSVSWIFFSLSLLQVLPLFILIFFYFLYIFSVHFIENYFLRALALFIGWGKNVLRFCFWFLFFQFHQLYIFLVLYSIFSHLSTCMHERHQLFWKPAFKCACVSVCVSQQVAAVFLCLFSEICRICFTPGIDIKTIINGLYMSLIRLKYLYRSVCFLQLNHTTNLKHSMLAVRSALWNGKQIIYCFVQLKMTMQVSKQNLKCIL